jgi:hypothetical protein
MKTATLYIFQVYTFKGEYDGLTVQHNVGNKIPPTHTYIR